MRKIILNSFVSVFAIAGILATSNHSFAGGSNNNNDEPEDSLTPISPRAQHRNSDDVFTEKAGLRRKETILEAIEYARKGDYIMGQKVLSKFAPQGAQGVAYIEEQNALYREVFYWGEIAKETTPNLKVFPLVEDYLHEKLTNNPKELCEEVVENYCQDVIEDNKGYHPLANESIDAVIKYQKDELIKHNEMNDLQALRACLRIYDSSNTLIKAAVVQVSEIDEMDRFNILQALDFRKVSTLHSSTISMIRGLILQSFKSYFFEKAMKNVHNPKESKQEEEQNTLSGTYAEALFYKNVLDDLFKEADQHEKDFLDNLFKEANQDPSAKEKVSKLEAFKKGRGKDEK